MLIEFCRTGGVCGRKIEASIDTDALPAGESAKIHGLIGLLRPERGQPPAKMMAGGPDRFSYTIKVTRQVGEDKMSSTFRFGEGKHGDLVQALTSMADAAA